MQRALGASEPTVPPMMKSPSNVPSPTVLQEKDKQFGKHEIPAAGGPMPTLTKKDDTLVPESSQSKAVISGTELDEKGQHQHKQQQPAVKSPSVQPLNASQVDTKPGPTQHETNKPLKKVPKAEIPPSKSAPAQPQPVKTETGSFFGFGGAKSQPTPTKPAESVTGKMFGFGSSIFNSASTLMTTPPASPKSRNNNKPPATHISPKSTPPVSPKHPALKDTKQPPVQKAEQEKKPEQPLPAKAAPSLQAKVDKAPSEPPKATASQAAPKAGQTTCPLCKVGLNMGSKDPPNYNTCTECKNDVCNQCGFNLMPHSAAVRIFKYS